MVAAALLLTCSLFGAPLTTTQYTTLLSYQRIVKGHITEMEGDLGPSPDLDKYRDEYLKAIPTVPFTPFPETDMRQTLAKATCIFLGDEHTTAASQENALAVLTWAAAGKGSLTLVLEWIDETYQPQVDGFLSGKMTLTALRKAIEYDKLWGFPWKGYARILDQAKRLKVRVILTERLKGKHSLLNRDTYITRKLAGDRSKNPDMRYLVIYGDYHILGNNHLSHMMGKAGFQPQVILFGDAESLYWSTLKTVRDPEKIRFLSAGHGLFYIRNGTPLERSISYRDYLMKLLGFKRDDFEEWVGKTDLAPFSGAPVPAVQRERFDALHAAPAAHR